MPTKEQEKQGADQERQERQQMQAAIGRQVLHTLGQPVDLHSVQVRRLWDDHYRVNVFVGADSFSAKIAHSFFLVADDKGNIRTSTPTIAKRY